MPAPPLATITLAAGKGTRMKSDTAKVLHEVFYRPMVHYVLDAAAPLEPDISLVIVGHQRERVEEALSGCDVQCVLQRHQNGTGHAVLCAEQYLDSFSGDVMILNGDAPLLLPAHLELMLQSHRSSGSRLTIMTTTLADPTNYGRVITAADGGVAEIVEEKDASAEQRLIRTINAGIYCVDSSFLFAALKQVTTDNQQGEMYLTDIVSIAVRGGNQVATFDHPHPEHVLGVNSRVELARAHSEIKARRNDELMAGGITMHDPQTTSVALSASVGADTVLGPQVSILGRCQLGSGCVIEANVTITDCTLGASCRIGAGSVLESVSLPPGTRLQPLTAMGPGQTG